MAFFNDFFLCYDISMLLLISYELRGFLTGNKWLSSLKTESQDNFIMFKYYTRSEQSNNQADHKFSTHFQELILFSGYDLCPKVSIQSVSDFYPLTLLSLFSFFNAEIEMSLFVHVDFKYVRSFGLKSIIRLYFRMTFTIFLFVILPHPFNIIVIYWILRDSKSILNSRTL